MPLFHTNALTAVVTKYSLCNFTQLGDSSLILRLSILQIRNYSFCAVLLCTPIGKWQKPIRLKIKAPWPIKVVIIYIFNQRKQFELNSTIQVSEFFIWFPITHWNSIRLKIIGRKNQGHIRYHPDFISKLINHYERPKRNLIRQRITASFIVYVQMNWS